MLQRPHLYLLALEVQAHELRSAAEALAPLLPRQPYLAGKSPGLSWCGLCLSDEEAEGEATRLGYLQHLLPHLRHSPLALYFPRPKARAVERWAFDLDGTLLPDELLPLLAEDYGCATEMARLTEAAMQGRVPFAESFAERTALLRGLPLERLQALVQHLPLPQGTASLLEQLRQAGTPLALVSGNYQPLVEQLAQRLHFPSFLGSPIHTDADGRLQGLASEGLVDEQRKRTFLLHWGQAHSTLYIGDGANDLPALAACGHALLVGEGFVRADGLAFLPDFLTSLDSRPTL